MIREIKPRKAKHAFEIKMSPDMLDYAQRFADMAAALKGVKHGESTCWIEYKNGAGTYTLTVYVNDDGLAARIRGAMAPAVPGVENPVGSTVTIHNPGATFDTYYAWPDREKHVPLFQYGDAPAKGYTGTVTHIGKHEDLTGPHETLYVINGRFIVGADAFKPKEK